MDFRSFSCHCRRKERYDSVYRGICALEGADYVYIHDGARPFIDNALLCRARDTVEQYHACAAGMPSKDTIKLINEQGFVTGTPERKYTWIIQTPQVFEYTLIRGAYEQIYQNMPAVQITDDAMVVETMLCTPVSCMKEVMTISRSLRRKIWLLRKPF